MRSNHSTRTKAWGKARAASRESALQREREQKKLETNRLQREREKRETSQGTSLNVIAKRLGMPQKAAISGRPRMLANAATNAEPKINSTGKMLAETKPKRAPEKQPAPEVLLTDPIR